MAETMLVTQALDERDLLVQKIDQRIEEASFVACKKIDETQVMEMRLSEEEFKREAERSYQEIVDLIKRYQRIDAAIIESNAHTVVKTSYGDYTMAAAIALRSRLRSKERAFDSRHPDNGSALLLMDDFESKLAGKLEDEFEKMIRAAIKKNKALYDAGKYMCLSVHEKESLNRVDEQLLEAVEAYIEQNKIDLVDPMHAKKLAKEMRLRHDALLFELDTQIGVSNAVTAICIE